MATRKKATPKRAIKKAAAKRKPRPAATNGMSAGESAATVEVEVRSLSEEQLDRISRDLSGGFQSTPFGDVGNQSNSAILQQIEVINLKHLSTKDRFAVLAMLDSEGYITSDTLSPMTGNAENLLFYLQQDFLALQHNNKFVRTCSEQAAQMNDVVSAPSVLLEVQIGFDPPAPLYPETMEVGGARYVRVA